VAVNKRETLISAAAQVIHERGVEGTTLSLAAQAADIPVGNVFYYFKSKAALVDAVVEYRIAELTEAMRSLDRHVAPVDKLCGFLELFLQSADRIAQLGCPYGALAGELELNAAGAHQRVQQLFAVQLDFLETQFQAMQLHDARVRAVELLCAVQGACRVAHTFHDADLFRSRLRALSDAVRQSEARSSLFSTKQ
jgi:TetR/AcrR family transcriptional regulator, transcriptional repressor for nem operon